MSTPTNAEPYDSRVLVEIVVAGVPKRVQVWTKGGRTYVSFPPTMTEAEATSLVTQGLALLGQVRVPELFKHPKGKLKRYIETEGGGEA